VPIQIIEKATDLPIATIQKLAKELGL
jgi:hypothetical protein